MSAMYDFDRAETAPMLSGLRPPMPRGRLEPFPKGQAPDVPKYVRLEPISPPVNLPGRFEGHAQAAGILTGLDFRADLAQPGATSYSYAELARPSFLNMGTIYDPFCQGVTLGVSNHTASTSGSFTVLTIIGSTANTRDVIQELFLPSRDALAGYERYTTANWDGYDADPITPATLAAARSFLGMLPRMFGDPDIAPGADGTIGLEWVFNNRPLRKLFIDIGPGGVWSGYWRRATGEKETLPTSSIDAATEPFLNALFKKLNF